VSAASAAGIDHFSTLSSAATIVLSQEIAVARRSDPKMMDRLRVRKVLRAFLIGVTTLALIHYGLKGTDGLLAGLLVVIGAIAVGMGGAKVWPEPTL
jgi:hypothetical protein